MNNTMKLEQQVTSLELSKKLKELGVKQDSLFYWLEDNNWNTQLVYNHEGDIKKTLIYEFHQDLSNPVTCSAFTVAELFDYLYTEKGELWIYHNAGKYLVQGFNSEANEENLADCLAKIIIANL